MNIVKATRLYETWLAGHLRLIKADLAAKHRLMARDAFSFLRATYYRWVQLFPALCPELARAHSVLGVGDIHVENYGTWRDVEGRLVWGINDFDEASIVPYTHDLTRLAASACLAIELNDLSLDPAAACSVIIEGYSQGLRSGGRPIVLAEGNAWLRKAVTSEQRDPVRFWGKLDALPRARQVPEEVMHLLKKAMPLEAQGMRVAHRRAGLGSLGRERFTALAQWRGAMIAREAKALAPSACLWQEADSKTRAIRYMQMLAQSVRAVDPFVWAEGKWLVRRLSPYCSRIELTQLARGHDEKKLLEAMGWELANVHLGNGSAIAAVRRDLRRRGQNWLRQAAQTMVKATRKDWQEWKGRG